MSRASSLLFLSAISLAVSGCGNNEDATALDQLDSKLGNKANADPALTMALEDQIMVDPALSGQANEDAIRPANEPYQALVPAGEAGAADVSGRTLGTLASQQAQVSKDKFHGCSLDVGYSMTWANRLPLDLSIYPNARVSEAAGSDFQGCNLRVVSFTAAATPRAVIDYYLSAAKQGGYNASNTVEPEGNMVTGWRSSDGAAFYVLIGAAGAGTSADLVSNRGR